VVQQKSQGSGWAAARSLSAPAPNGLDKECDIYGGEHNGNN
jgi:hypothetical protein